MLNEVLSPGYKLDFNCLKATETEPWDQHGHILGEIMREEEHEEQKQITIG